jgi:hypothetical protein
VPGPAGDAAAGGGLSAAELSGWVAALGRMPVDVDDRERIDRLRVLEELKSAAAAAQAVTTAAFARSQRAACGVPTGGDPDEPDEPGDSGDGGGAGFGGVAGADCDGAGVGGVVAGARSDAGWARRRRRAAQAARSIRCQVALARKQAPRCGGRHVGLAEVLVYEMPRTLAALAAGVISEWRATLVCRETAGLSRQHRAVVDAELEGLLAGAGDRRVAQLARAAAYRLDPRAVVDRAGRAASDRRVTIRPAPDTMTYVSALLPVASGVAVFAALRGAADAALAAGDGRGRGQVMADTLVDRILHPDTAARGSDRNDGDETLNDLAAHADTDEGTADAGTADEGTADDVAVDADTVDEDAAGDGVAGSDAGCARFDDPVAAVRAAYAAARAREAEAAGAPVADHIVGAAGTDRAAGGGAGAATGEGSVSPPRPGPSGGPPGSWGGGLPPPAVGVPPGVNVQIGLVMTDQALFGRGEEPALLDGEVIPAGVARALLADLLAASKAWIRRLYTRPDSGQLAAMDSRRRVFDDSLRRFILLRDQRCRTPWCDAPIRHADHVRPAARGGPTSAGNGEGLSADCNYVRQAPGWHASIDDAASGGTLRITTPTGHTYTSTPPALPRPRPGPGPDPATDEGLPATGS